MRRGGLLLALVCHVTFASTYAVRTPAFEGPDENDHLYYASLLALKHTLPIIKDSWQERGLSPWDQAALGHHPPLYYLVLAGTMHALGQADTVPVWSNAGVPRGSVMHWVHGFDEVPPRSPEIELLWVLRGWSVLLGLVTIWMTWWLARLTFPEQPALASGAALLLACLPQFSFMHGVLDNGNLASALCHATLVLLVLAASRAQLTVRRGLWLGMLAGAALLTKLTTLFLLPVMLAAYAVAWWRMPGQRAVTARSAITAGAAITALAGWYFARNWRLYGDPLASAAHRAAFASNLVPPGRLLEWLLHGFPGALFVSFVGNFGWETLAVPQVVLAAAALAALLALCGFLLSPRQRRPSTCLWLPVLAIVLQLAAVVQFNLHFLQPQGRYLFPVAGPIMVLTAAGVARLAARLPGFARPVARWLAMAMPIVVGASVLWLHFVPRFRLQPDAGPFYASLVAGITTPPPPGQAALQLTAPLDGARIDQAPTFAWRDGGSGPFAVHGYTASGRILFATEQHRTFLKGDEWEFPAAYWSMLPIGEPIYWKVRRVPNREHGEDVEHVPRSRPSMFVRVR